jgi:hypothetical protein
VAVSLVRIVSGLLLLPTTGFTQTPGLPDGSAPERRVVIEAIASRLETSYVPADVATKMAETLRARASDGTYDGIPQLEKLAQRLTADLHALSGDGHLRVRYHADPAQVIPAWNTPAPGAEARYRRQSARRNYGFVRVEILAGNVGYLRLDEFGDPQPGGETAAAAMGFVAHTDSLIIDLRANGGGHPGMTVVLATYLFGDRRVHLSDFHIRERKETIQAWTAPFVPGPSYADKPVFILAGPGTASAAESFTYDLQSLNRVQVVGKRTAGAAHPGGFVRISEHFAVFIPNGRPVNPVTGTNWERTGVQPDVEVAVEEALTRAHIVALEKLLAKESSVSPDREAQLKALAALREAPKNPLTDG